jgi:hypothetical protein
VLDVRKTSDPKAFPRDNATIPRVSVTTLRLTRSSGNWGRNLGITLGVLGGVTRGGYTAAKTADSGGAGIAIFLGVAAAVSIGGYLAGKAADRKVTIIHIPP